jgi:hypothetical protein
LCVSPSAASTPTEKATIEVVALMFQSILAEERIPPSARVVRPPADSSVACGPAESGVFSAAAPLADRPHDLQMVGFESNVGGARGRDHAWCRSSSSILKPAACPVFDEFQKFSRLTYFSANSSSRFWHKAG